jgi:Flp pilus assembly protein TadB
VGPPRRSADRGRGHAALLQVVAAGGAAVAVLLVLPGAFAWAAAPVAGVLVWRRSSRWESATQRRRRARLEAELPHVVDLMVAALAAGAAPGDAMGRVADVVDRPAAEELAVWVARLRLGADPVAVWSAMGRHPQFSRLGTALRRSAESGAPVAAALGRLAEDLRARRRADVEGRVRQVEVKAAVPLGVCLLPAFVLVGVVPLVAGSVIGLLGVR